MHVGTSDHWPVVLSCENILFGPINIFPLINWKAFEAIIVLLQTFWLERVIQKSWSLLEKLLVLPSYNFKTAQNSSNITLHLDEFSPKFSDL